MTTSARVTGTATVVRRMKGNKGEHAVIKAVTAGGRKRIPPQQGTPTAGVREWLDKTTSPRQQARRIVWPTPGGPIFQQGSPERRAVWTSAFADAIYWEPLSRGTGGIKAG